MESVWYLNITKELYVLFVPTYKAQQFHESIDS